MNGLVPILAEVADKEPTLLKFWMIALVLSIAAVALGLWRRWAALVAAAMSILWAYAVWSELQDRFVGPAIQQELGSSYVIQGYVTPLLPLILVALVLFWRRPNAA